MYASNYSADAPSRCPCRFVLVGRPSEQKIKSHKTHRIKKKIIDTHRQAYTMVLPVSMISIKMECKSERVAYHVLNPDNVVVLFGNLVVHVDSHVSQVAHTVGHILHVFLHLVLLLIVRVFPDEASERGHPLHAELLRSGSPHHLWLVEALGVRFSGDGFRAGHTQSPAWGTHTPHRLLCLHHVLINVPHALLKVFQLFPLVVQRHEGLDSSLLGVRAHGHTSPSCVQRLIHPQGNKTKHSSTLISHDKHVSLNQVGYQGKTYLISLLFDGQIKLFNFRERLRRSFPFRSRRWCWHPSQDFCITQSSRLTKITHSSNIFFTPGKPATLRQYSEQK